MLDIPTARAKLPTLQARRTAAPSATGSVTNPLTAQPADATGGGATLASQATSANPWMGYNEFFAGNEAALHPAPGITNKDIPGYNAATDPNRFTQEYNQYKEGLPLIYQDLINYGISPESVASGGANSILRGSAIEKIPTDPAEAMAIYGSTRGAAVGAPGGPTSSSGPLPGGVGSGSYNTLPPDVINKMWR